MTPRRFWTIALLGSLSAFALHQLSRPNKFQHDFQTVASVSQPSISAVSRSLRPNYPYSVVPGGVYSPAELRTAAQKDESVQSHYSDFDLRNAHLIANSNDRFQYVSFRMNGKIFWTHRKILIPKDEVLLTDGKNFCRTRCGNRLSDAPHRETTAMEPSEHVLNMPPFHPEMLRNGELTLAAPPDLDSVPADGIAGPARLAPVLPGGDEAALNVPKTESPESGVAAPLLPAGFFGIPGLPRTSGSGPARPVTVPPQPASSIPVPTSPVQIPVSPTPGVVPPGGGTATPPIPTGLKPTTPPVTPIPEPSTSAMASLAFGLAIYLGWRKAKASHSH